jgi:hypothetical protein
MFENLETCHDMKTNSTMLLNEPSKVLLHNSQSFGPADFGRVAIRFNPPRIPIGIQGSKEESFTTTYFKDSERKGLSI